MPLADICDNLNGTATTATTKLRRAALTHFRELQEKGHPFVSKRRLLYSAWDFMTKCDEWSIFALPVISTISRVYEIFMNNDISLFQMFCRSPMR